MATLPVNINFDALSQAFQNYVREKARQSGSTIIYKKDDQLIEEDPRTKKKKVLKQYPHIAR